ncbi:MAG: hypothetical protein JWQ96_2174 [Segetibacter sp.]|nr:hypothetical protein [Segetibacter sp.]
MEMKEVFLIPAVVFHSIIVASQSLHLRVKMASFRNLASTDEARIRMVRRVPLLLQVRGIEILKVQVSDTTMLKTEQMLETKTYTSLIP